MAEQVQIPHQSITFPTLYDPSVNPFTKTIEVCGCKACVKCAGTGNKNFPKGGETTSRHSFPYPCSTCKGTGKETYYETRDNPYFGKTVDEIDKIIYEYKVYLMIQERQKD